MTYKTRTDWLLIGLMTVFMSVCLGGGVFMLARGGDPVIGGAGVLAFLAIVLMGVPTRYALADGQLIVRSGLFLWKIPIDRITEVHYTSNPMNAPAWSWRRLRVNFRNPSGKMAFILISPKDRRGFLRDLAELDPVLELTGERLVRPSGIPIAKGDDN